MNPTDATIAAIQAVVAAIERCPRAIEARDRAALIIRGAQEPEADLAAAEHAALRLCAEAAVATMHSDPPLSHLVTVAALAVYILKQATVIALGTAGPVELVLRDPHLN